MTFAADSGRITAKPDVILQRPSDQRHWVLLAQGLLPPSAYGLTQTCPLCRKVGLASILVGLASILTD